MSLLSFLTSLCRNIIAKGRVERDLNDELSSYIDLATKFKMKSGLSEPEARRAVLLEMEGAEQVKERVRETRTGYRIEMFLQDLRFAFRSLRKSPVFALTVLGVLALGIGSTTLMFTIVNSVLFEGPPYPQSDRLVTLWNRIPEEPRISFSPREFTAWSKQTQLFENLAFVTGTGFTVSGQGDPQMITGRMVSPAFFAVLRVSAFLGRTFTEQETNQDLVILSYGLWRERFGSRREIVGESITMNGKPYTVIGVMPETFVFEASDAKLFVPAALDSPFFSEHPDAHFLRVFGRLKLGVTRQQLDAEVNLLGSRVDDPGDHMPRRYFALSLKELTSGELRTPLFVLLSAVVFLLLIACANVANLILSRTNVRQSEISLRAALGASRSRLMAQLLTESAVLAGLGGLLGLGVAFWALEFLRASIGKNVPELVYAHTGAWSYLIAFLAWAFTIIVFGLGPARSASRANLDELKNSMRSSSRALKAHQLLVFGEVALAAALLVCCTLMIRSFAALIHVDPGFRPANVITAEVFLTKERYPGASEMLKFYRASLDKLQTSPVAESIGLVTHLPFGGNSWGNTFDVEGYVSPAGVEHSAQIRPVSPGYFETLGIPLRDGVGFKLSDDERAPRVAVINAALAKRFWPNESPIGRRIRYYREWLAIIGVCGDIKHVRLDAESDMEIYVPYLQMAGDVAQFVGRDLNYVVRSSRTGIAAVELRKAIHGLDPQLVVKLNTMEALIHESTAQPRFRTWLVAIFSASAVILACVGVYGVIAYLVTQRYREIGIRMALGATRGSILQLVLGRTAVLAAAGIAAGLFGALLLSRFLTSMLYGISAHDPISFIGVPVCLVIVALLAAYLPARRAAKVDPIASLRYE